LPWPILRQARLSGPLDPRSTVQFWGFTPFTALKVSHPGDRLRQEPEDEDAEDGSGARTATQGTQRRAEHPVGCARTWFKPQHRNEVSGSPEPVTRSPRRRGRPVCGAVKPRPEELIAEWEPRSTAKQRITAMPLHRQLALEGYRVGRTLVGDYWRERRRQRAEVYCMGESVTHPRRDLARARSAIVTIFPSCRASLTPCARLRRS
jgi:hypothetical protein